MSQIIDTKLICKTAAGKLIKAPAKLEFSDDGKIYFLKSPFALKDEIKAMQGSKWHGFETENPRKVWSVKDCLRNRIQLQILMGNNPFEFFDQDIKHYEYTRPLMQHQKDMSDAGLTFHFQIWGAEMGVGKTLSAIEVMEKSGRPNWFWVGPKSALMAAEREFKKWQVSKTLNIEAMTYEGLVKRMTNWNEKPPHGVIFDEASRLKNPRSQRSQAAQALADGIRVDWGDEGYVILMSGTPAPKSPCDWWSLAEVCYPGWVKEGHISAFEKRLAFIVNKEGLSGVYPHRIGWKDNELKCNVCGLLYDEGPHGDFAAATESEAHTFESSINECEYLNKRLAGLVIVKHKKDCLDLPEKQYRIVQCEPTPTTLRVAKAIVQSAPNVITGLTLLRELSDGFQYQDKVVGKTKCPACEDGTCSLWVDPDDKEKVYQIVDMMAPEYVSKLKKIEGVCPVCGGTQEVDKIERVTKEVPTPKEAVLVDLLEENEEQGRIVIFSGFMASVDRVMRVCQKEKWNIVRLDGRGGFIFDSDNKQLSGDILDYWANLENNKVAFVAHPRAGGMGLNLTESRTVVYWSNDYNAEARTQSEDRAHRVGADMNKGVTIVDLIHLPSDKAVLDILKQNRDLEKLTLGEFQGMYEKDTN